MKNTRILALCNVLLTALFIVACDWEGIPGAGDYNNFAYDLQGTWVSNDPSVYSGTIKIEYNRITISGYSESQTPIPGGDDNRRPFKDFTREVPLKGYSEEGDNIQENIINGNIFIEDGGLQKSIPYTYWVEDGFSPDYIQRQCLRFNFGGRQETLVKTAR